MFDNGSETVPVKRKTVREAEEPKVCLGELFDALTEWCDQSEIPIVQMIDEVDSAANNQVFLNFLSQLRAGYIKYQYFLGESRKNEALRLETP